MGSRLPVLAEIWREVCQHTAIEESLARVAGFLRPHVPFRELLIQHIDLNRPGFDTVAQSSVLENANRLTRTELGAEQLGGLLAWGLRKELIRCNSLKLPMFLRSALPKGIREEVILGPLVGIEELLGLFVVVIDRHAEVDAAHERIIHALLEPLSIAMQNDARIRELAALREAAEADKRSLLTRLGRQEINEQIVGAENGLKHVMERVDLVARSDAPVLIFGETGSGKEVIARAVHSRSPRASAPFHRVNCGAIPPDLIDSELFGHEKGSFTGAANLRKGWFERADGGTLFLDEIGELPPAAQVRLLRILQDGTFERVGGQRQLHVNVRIVAATHRNLQAMVAENRFREDLWYRVAVFPIFLPSLRDRPEDIPELAFHFAMKSARRFGLTPIAPSPSDMHLLISYPWPGNVRELGAVMDRAVILGNGKQLEIAKALGASPPPIDSRTDFSQIVPSSNDKEFVTLDAAMKKHIEMALAKTRGRVEGVNGAATLLAINPYTLRARMRKLGVDWTKFRA